jgi:phosphoserine phosphatase
MDDVSGSQPRSIQRPLIVDLDGTLVRSDVLVEMGFAFLARLPFRALMIPIWIAKGKAHLKSRISEAVALDVATLPYDDAVLARIRAAHAQGRPVYLASAADERVVQSVAQHLGVFEGWFASDGKVNLSAESKADLLVKAFGERGFDYIGNGRADLPVWSRAATAIAIRAPKTVIRRLQSLHIPVEHLADNRFDARAWLRLLRPHQWMKNALIGIPLLTAHQFNLAAISQAAIAFVAFSNLRFERLHSQRSCGYRR